MRDEFVRGENAMDYARRALGRNDNLSAATLIAYDLQAGAYVRHALSDPVGKQRWCAQLAGLVAPHLPFGGSVMEVGSGEATTLAGLLEALPYRPTAALGFDMSWSRCAHGRGWLRHKAQQAVCMHALDLQQRVVGWPHQASGLVRQAAYQLHAIHPLRVPAGLLHCCGAQSGQQRGAVHSVVVVGSPLPPARCMLACMGSAWGERIQRAGRPQRC
jgi:hypothetical protein